MDIAWPLLQFVVCVALIGSAGFVLSASADRIAEATGLGRGWIGLALLATVTSLPELASGIASVTWMAAPNLAVGNVLGACVLNLVFLVVVDTLHRHEPMYRSASPEHLLSSAFGIVMLGFVALSVLLAHKVPSVLNLGLYSPLLLGLYLLALRSVHAHDVERRRAAPSTPPSPDDGLPLTRAGWRFATAAMIVVAAGSWLPSIADQLAHALGWSRSFAGTVFMAVATTMPEMAVTLSALRLRALDLAIGNLLGSNLFNLAILAIDDLFYAGAPLLAVASPVHAGTAMAASVMSALVIVGLVMRPQGRLLRVASWISAALVVVYLLNATLVFLHGA